MIRKDRRSRLSVAALLSILASLSAPLLQGSSITTCPAGGTPLLICATYNSSITGNANAATIEGTINAAIIQIESHFYNPITVNISFDDSSTLGSNVGQNNASSYAITYQSFIQALQQDSNQPYVAAALASLQGTTNPVNGNTQMAIKAADARALGITIPNLPSSDGNVSLNLNVMNLSRSTSPTGSQYDLETVAMHEITEVLGLGSTLGQSFQSTGLVSPEDLFRYDTAGTRTFATGTAAWFEITPGTRIAQFNSSAGLDYGDWQNVSGHVHIQDAVGTQGVAGQVNLSTAEIEALAVIGYQTSTATATPEPSTWILFLTGAAIYGLLRARYTEAK